MFKQVKSILGSIWEERRKVFLFRNVSTGNNIGSKRRINSLNVLLRRSASGLKYSLNLVESRSTRKERFSVHHLSKNASYRPNINSFCILTGIENDFRCTIPSCNNVFSLLLLFLNITSRQSKITNFQITGFIL